MKIRAANTRGQMKKSWITSLRTFSNNDYWHPDYMNWNCLKVINDDLQQPGGMVPNHEHKNYDILGYIVEGELEHTDSLGNVSRAVPGQIQHMWAGSSIWHTERCIGDTPARYIQIWFTPNRNINTQPRYQLHNKPLDFDRVNIALNSDLIVGAGFLKTNCITTNSYLYVVSGSCRVGSSVLTEGDGAEIAETQEIIPLDNPHILLFEQPA